MLRDSRLSVEDVRASLWFGPAVAACGAYAVTLGLLRVRPSGDPLWARLAFPGDASSAATVLQTVATAVMTATTLTFSLTVLALQLASQQFSPRLLREFARDRLIQVVLAVLVSTFVVSLTGLRGLDSEQPLPVLVLALAFVLGLVSALALLAFLGHLTRSLRVDTMLTASHSEVTATLPDAYPEYGDERKAPRAGLPGPGGGTLIPCRQSGFVRTVDPQAAVRVAAEHGLFLLLAIRPGDMVVRGAPLAAAWRTDGDGPVPVDDVVEGLRGAVRTGYERTVEQDAALGLRQLVDVAVKAISPGINDPVTAAHAVAYCADVLVRLQHRRLGPQEHLDEEGAVRVVTPDRDLPYYLDLVCGPLRRFGRSEPQVLNSLLRMLRDCAAAARDDEQRTQIARQAALIVDNMDGALIEDDQQSVRDMARRVAAVLDGDVDAGYRDRAGETRSV